MKIAFFTDNFYPELSGIADSVTLLAQALVRQGHEILIVSPHYSQKNYGKRGADQEDVRLKGIQIARLPSIIFPGSPTGQGRIVIPFGKSLGILKKFKPDIVHIHSPFGAGLDGLFAARVLHIPVVGTNHTIVSEFVKYVPVNFSFAVKIAERFFSWFYNHCRAVTTPCSALVKNMQEKGLNVPCRSLSNPVNSSNFRPVESETRKAELKKHWGFTPHTILYRGRLAVEKHVDVIIDAIPLVKKEIPDVLLAIGGHGSAEKSLHAQVTSLGLESHVKFLGFLSGDEHHNVYQASDVFAIMSTSDTQGLALMDAMTSGLPVVGARSWGLAEYIREENGLLVEEGDSEALAKALITLFKNPLRSSELGRNGARMMKQYTPDTVAREWEEIYETYMTKKPKVSVVIPAYNEEGSIGNCIDALLKNGNSHFHEIIVIDNASTDRTKTIVEDKIRRGTGNTLLRVVTETHKGLTRARQRGLLEATGDLIAYNDADTLLPPGWAEKALRVFMTNKNIVCLSGPYRYHDGIWWKNKIMTVLWYLSAPLTYRMVGYMVLGGNFIARKTALEAMGGFDKNIEFYGEDTDIARRLSKHGKVMFRMDFFIYSSGRRFEHEGLIKTNITYALNFIWQVLFHKPFTWKYRDIRVTTKNL